MGELTLDTTVSEGKLKQITFKKTQKDLQKFKAPVANQTNTEGHQ